MLKMRRMGASWIRVRLPWSLWRGGWGRGVGIGGGIGGAVVDGGMMIVVAGGTEVGEGEAEMSIAPVVDVMSTVPVVVVGGDTAETVMMKTVVEVVVVEVDTVMIAVVALVAVVAARDIVGAAAGEFR